MAAILLELELEFQVQVDVDVLAVSDYHINLLGVLLVKVELQVQVVVRRVTPASPWRRPCTGTGTQAATA